MRLQIFTLFILLSQIGAAQPSSFKKNFNGEFGLQLFSEWGTTPVLSYEGHNSALARLDTFKGSADYLRFIGVSYEARYNIAAFQDRSSVSLGVPVRLSMNIGTGEAEGTLFAVGSGLLLDYNIGYRSTYNNISTDGYAVGLGLYADRYSGAMFGMGLSPAVRLKARFLLDRLWRVRISMLMHMGIPWQMETQEGEMQRVNNYSGLQLIITP